jgi:hypothetical protein
MAAEPQPGEEFLAVHYETVDAVLPWLGHNWCPNFNCNDHVRQRRVRLLAAGQLAELSFDSAVMFHGREGLSSIRLYLRSSARFVVARIYWVGAGTRVDVLADLACISGVPIPAGYSVTGPSAGRT